MEKEYKLQLKTADCPLVIKAYSSYTKDGLICFSFFDKEGKKMVKKFPLCNVHSLEHEY